MSALILDTETHDLNGYPIEIAYAPCSFEQGVLVINQGEVFDEYFSCPEPIALGALATHHILEADIAEKPSFDTFKMPQGVQYLIGHNIDYDIRAIAKCGIDTSNIKAICTLALARLVWPEAEAHNISALIYMISKGSEKAREMIKKAHRADMDIILTANILMHQIHHLKIQNIEALYAASEDARIPRTINFGKHRGSAIADLPADYMQWLLRQEDLDPYLRKAIQNTNLVTL